MDKSQKVIIALLIIAIAFSLVSIGLNMSVAKFEAIDTQVSGNPGGQVSINIQEPMGNTMESENGN